MRQKKNYLLWLIAGAACLLATCFSPMELAIEFSDSDAEKLFETLNLTHPLPPGYKKSSTVNKDAITIKVITTSPRQTTPSPAGGYIKQIHNRFYAPVVPLSSPITDITESDLDNVKLLPLTDILLPDKALPFEGLYPGDPDYRLTERSYLIIEPPEDKPLPRDLEKWMDQLPVIDSTSPIIWIGGVGDIMPGEGAGELLEKEGVQAVFRDTLPLLKEQDLMLGNLEAAATYYDIKNPKSFNYKFPPPLLEKLLEAGFDYFAFTNNHCYDYGEQGFRDTIDNLKKYGVPTSGAGLTPHEASLPWKTEVKGMAVTIMSLGAYPQEWNGFNGRESATVSNNRAGILWADERGLDILEQVFREESFNIVMVHGGVERTLVPTEEQRELYKSFINRGADLVLGSHPHALQGLEAYNGGLIAYSLGNFIFPDEVIYRYAKVTAILSLGIHDLRIKYIRVHSVAMEGAFVEYDSSEAGRNRIISLTEGLSPP